MLQHLPRGRTLRPRIQGACDSDRIRLSTMTCRSFVKRVSHHQVSFHVCETIIIFYQGKTSGGP